MLKQLSHPGALEQGIINERTFLGAPGPSGLPEGGPMDPRGVVRHLKLAGEVLLHPDTVPPSPSQEPPVAC